MEYVIMILDFENLVVIWDEIMIWEGEMLFKNVK